ncbi:hypothetical protein VP01_1398g2 [Puccinia sorghi]|uniref:Uncharacterized protein n=1 Tax=Puccinia sorghi TaxID=27349 RepID=A0A0L6VL76_9BASI|nr:hypothetical protein VP01_1398g2 [Puccinia sorghi]
MSIHQIQFIQNENWLARMSKEFFFSFFFFLILQVHWSIIKKLSSFWDRQELKFIMKAFISTAIKSTLTTQKTPLYLHQNFFFPFNQKLSYLPPMELMYHLMGIFTLNYFFLLSFHICFSDQTISFILFISVVKFHHFLQIIPLLNRIIFSFSKKKKLTTKPKIKCRKNRRTEDEKRRENEQKKKEEKSECLIVNCSLVSMHIIGLLYMGFKANNFSLDILIDSCGALCTSWLSSSFPFPFFFCCFQTSECSVSNNESCLIIRLILIVQVGRSYFCFVFMDPVVIGTLINPYYKKKKKKKKKVYFDPMTNQTPSGLNCPEMAQISTQYCSGCIPGLTHVFYCVQTHNTHSLLSSFLCHIEFFIFLILVSTVIHLNLGFSFLWFLCLLRIYLIQLEGVYDSYGCDERWLSMRRPDI